MGPISSIVHRSVVFAEAIDITESSTALNVTFHPHQPLIHRHTRLAQAHQVSAIFADQLVANTAIATEILGMTERLDVGNPVAVRTGEGVALLFSYASLTVPGEGVTADAAQH